MRGVASSAVKSVGIWIRVSTEDQVKGESPEHHERRARGYAEAKGWRVAEVYRLEAVSGKSVMGHSEAKRMLADLRAGLITGLVFSKLARLARNTKELLEFAEVFRACDADLVSLAEAIDTSTAAGRLFFTMIAAMAEWEREEIGDRVRASVPVRAKMGKSVGGAAPFGYQWKDKRLQLDPKEAPTRTLLYDLFIEHRRKKTVARLLNERGYRTRSGSPFSDTTVDRLLRDPIAKGLHRANYTFAPEVGKAWTLKPESEWVWTEVEALISEEVWDRCIGILDAQRASVRKPAKKTVQLFAGFAFCHCGAAMYVRHDSTKYVCQKCRNKIPIEDLEAVYREQLSGFLLSPEDISAHHQAAKEAMGEKAQLIERAEAELKKNTADEDELFRLFHVGALATQDFGRRHQPLSERRLQLEDELPRLQAELDILRIGTLSQEATLEEARDLALRWTDLALEERRQIVEAITERIVVGREDVEINLLQVLPPSGTSGKIATQPHRFVADQVPPGPAHIVEALVDRGTVAPLAVLPGVELGADVFELAQHLGGGVMTLAKPSQRQVGFAGPAARALPRDTEFRDERDAVPRRPPGLAIAPGFDEEGLSERAFGRGLLELETFGPLFQSYQERVVGFRRIGLVFKRQFSSQKGPGDESAAIVKHSDPILPPRWRQSSHRAHLAYRSELDGEARTWRRTIPDALTQGQARRRFQMPAPQTPIPSTSTGPPGAASSNTPTLRTPV